MNLFLNACGADGPLLLNVDGKDWVFPRPFIVIGRDPRADFVLDHPAVSRRHAYLQVIDGHLFCFDLGSRTGIQWNGGRSARGGWLDRGESIQIGPYSVSLSLGVGEDYAETEIPVDRPNPLMTQFPDPPLLMETTLKSPRGVVKKDGITVNRLSRVLSVAGRAPRCEPYLTDQSVSWLHCSLLRTPMGTWVVDLLGRGGIAVNGVSVRFAQLADGDELGVGYHLIRIRLDDGARLSERTEGRPVPTMTLALNSHGPSWTGIEQSTWATIAPLASSTSREIVQASRPTPLSPIMERGSGLGELVPAELGVTNDSLMAIMNQFGQQQQQMFEQFLQSMLTMFQMSSSMHREGQESIRRELGQLCKLTEELSEVRAELASLRSPTVGAAPQANGKIVLPNGRERRPATERPSTESKTSAEPQAHSADPAQPVDGSAVEQGDFYDWLSQRMETLQSEQQSRWRNLMNLVLGRQHGGAAP